MMNQKIKKNKEFIKHISILIILTILPIISIHAYRYYFMDGIIPGQESYENLLISENLDQSSYEATPYHYILSYSSKFFDLQSFSLIFSLMLGLLTIFLSYLIFKEFFDEDISFMASVLLALSPVFVSKFSGLSIDNFFVLIVLATIFIIIKKSDSAYFYLIIPLAIIAGSFGFFYLIIYVFSCVSISLNFNNKKSALITVILTILFSAIFYKQWYLNSLKEPFMIQQNTISLLIADSGHVNGLGFFSMLLAFAGIIFTWKENKDKYFSHHVIFFLALFTSAFFYSNLIFYINFLVCFLAAIGLMKFHRMNWRLPMIKKMTIWFMIYGLIFSLFFNISLISKQDPTPDLKDAILNLDNVSLSDPSYGYWIDYYSNSTPYIKLDFNDKEYIRKLNRTNEIFNSRNLEKTRTLVKEEKIKVILIDEKMRDVFWKNEKSGLLFVLNNSEFMTKIYENDNTAIWEIK